MMGAEGTKQQHFKSILDRFTALNGRVCLSEEDIMQASDHSDEDDPSLSRSSSVSPAARSSLPPMSQEIYVPFVRHGSSVDLQNFSQPTPTYDTGVLNEMASSDDNAGADELLEEEELDQRDLEMAESAEAELWAKYGSTWETENNVEPSVELELDSKDWAFRYGQPSGVKSQVFVEDSD